MVFGNKNKVAKKSKKRKNKVNLVFDENKRREFLTGFHKRKVQRKKEAKEKFERELKEERKRIKAEARESYKKLVVSHRPIPELEDLPSEQYEDDDVTVKVVELSASDIAKRSNWIGINQPQYEKEEESEEEKVEEEVPGMSLKEPLRKKVKEKTEVIKFQSEKDVKKVLKKQATKTVKKSKIFQKKNKLERQKQKKKSLETKKQKSKFINRKEKKRKGGKNRGRDLN